jgi:hypothetical protein
MSGPGPSGLGGYRGVRGHWRGQLIADLPNWKRNWSASRSCLLEELGAGTDHSRGSVQSFSHIWFGLSGARQWLKR